ncbi:MAG TPA: dienelactone hydrolase family protein [Pseudomonadales bacterium]|jgi:carboxymethylenebutenolidase|nr:dienelactone hydrolase family protein [Pseudomonadales bacterium]
MGQTKQLRAIDGFAFGAYEATPSSKPRGGIVVIQEIFGVNSHIRNVADGYAAAGYAAIAPQIFDRVERNVELGYEPTDMTRGVEIARGKLKMEQTLQDLQAAIDDAKRFGKVGVVGYCFGGLMAWLAACELNGVSAVVSYYGGGVASQLDRKPRCPVMMHFGDKDAHIPLSDVDKVRKAHPGVNVNVYAADHGFNCDHRASYDAAAAKLALSRSLDFFAKNVG